MKNERWTWRPLGELFAIGAGKTMSAAARSGANKTPFLRTSNVFWDRIDLSTVDKMAIPEHELSAKSLQPGDLLVCEGGEIGRAAIWNGEMETMSFQNHLHRLRPIADNAEPRFYVYFLQSAFTQLGIFEGSGNKTTIPNISRSRLAALEVPHPPLDEQRAIAASLAQVREAIGRHDQITLVAQELKRAAMRKLFTRGLHGEAQKKTEIGPVPQGWEMKPLGMLCEETDTVNIRHEGDRTIEYVDVSSVSRDSLTVESTARYVLRKAPGRARKRILEGDVIFATVRPAMLRTACVTAELDNEVCSTAFCVLRRNRKIAADKFVYYLVQREQFIRQLAAIETGASYPAITDRALKEQLVPVPGIGEQSEIASILDTIDRKINLHRRKRAMLDDLFKTLLHKLMTGQIRAADLDISADRTGAEDEKEHYARTQL